MLRHRRLLLGLALSALMGFSGSQAQAGSISLSVDLNGVVIYTATSVSPDQSVSAALVTLNDALKAHGSAYVFSSLSANSNYQGDGTGFLQTTGQLSTSGTGTTAATLSIDTSQSGFTAPLGTNGMLMSTSSGSYINSVGSSTYTSDFQGTNATPLTNTLTGTGSYSTPNPPPTVGIGSVPSGYSLSNHFSISLTKAANLTYGFSGEAIVTASVVPEPSSVVMFLTGMPLPLALAFGAIRRRRASA
jgi:hypothetical protein